VFTPTIDGESGLLDMIEKRNDFYITFNIKSDTYDQIQKQIQATERERGYLVVYYNNDNGTEEDIVLEVPKDEERIIELLANWKRLKKRNKKKGEKTVSDLVSHFSSLGS